MRPSMTAIIQKTAQVTGISGPTIRNGTRLSPVVAARYVVFGAAYSLGYTSIEIGEFFTMHHTSVLHGIKNAEEKQTAKVIEFFKPGAVGGIMETLEIWAKDIPEIRRPSVIELKDLCQRLGL